MKKILAMLLSVAIIASIAIGGTVAFLSDSDGAVNVVNVGNVFITQYEKERVKNADGYTNELKDFVGPAYVVPVVTKNTAAKTDVTIEGRTVQLRAGSVKNYVDKIVYAKNEGTVGAYVRTVIAFPEADDFDTTWNSPEQWLHWNAVADGGETNCTDANNGWIWGKNKTTAWPGNTDNWDVVENVEIEGQKYDLYVATNKNVIKPEEVTAPNLLGFYIDERVDNEKKADGTIDYIFETNGKTYHLGDISDLKILVMTQAVQADGFDDAWVALDEAFGDITSTNHPWKNGIDDPAAKARATTLADQLKGLKTASGAKTITLESGATYDFSEVTDWSPVSIESKENSGTLEITIDGNDAVIKNLSQPLFGDVKAKSITIKNLTIDGAEMVNNATADNVATAYGAFIQYADNTIVHPDITLDGCHLKNSTISSVQTNAASGTTPGDYVGGLIGYVAAGNVKITNCSVEGCKINGNESVGGIIGARQGTLEISGTTVSTSDMVSKKNGSWRIGEVIGTITAGSTVTITCTVSGNTYKQDGATAATKPADFTTKYRSYYGRNYGTTTINSMTIDTMT